MDLEIPNIRNMIEEERFMRKISKRPNQQEGKENKINMQKTRKPTKAENNKSQKNMTQNLQ